MPHPPIVSGRLGIEMNFTRIFLILLIFPSIAWSEEVVKFEVARNLNGRPCQVEFISDRGTKISLQVSEYKDVWSMSFWINNRADKFKSYFQAGFSAPDAEKFLNEFKEISFSGKEFQVDEGFIYSFGNGASSVDDRTQANLEIKLKHRVVAILKAMKDDGISVPGLIELSGTVEGSSKFRECAYAAFDLPIDSSLPVDSRAELRLIFEKSFKRWVESSSQAQQCMVGRLPDAEIEKIISTAADTFYPGMMNLMKRRDYRDQLTRMVPLARLSGMAAAKADGCFMAGQLSQLSSLPMEQAIRAAQELK